MVAEAGRAEQRVQLHAEVKGAARHDPDGHADHAHRRGQEDRAADDREVVDDRGKDGGHEAAARVEHARRDRAEGEEDRAQEHDPGQLHRGRQLRGVEAGGDGGNDRRSEDEEQPGEDREPGEHEVRDRRHDAPGPIRLVVGQQRRDRGDERRGKRPCSHELEDQVRDPERGEEGVEGTLDPEGGAEHDEAHPAEHARDEERAGHQQPGADEGAAASHRGPGVSSAGADPRSAECARG